MKRLIGIVCGVVLAIFVVRFFLPHQVDPVLLDSLDESMNERDVEAILGKPTSVVTNDALWTSWRYDRFSGVYCEVVLSFDDRGTYHGRFHDH